MDMQEYFFDRNIELEIVVEKDWSIDESGWKHKKYDLRFLCNGRTFDTPYVIGAKARTPENEPWQVFQCAYSDSLTYMNSESFEDFAEEFDRNPDSRKEEAAYREMGEYASRFVEFIGMAEFEFIRDNVEMI